MGKITCIFFSEHGGECIQISLHIFNILQSPFMLPVSKIFYIFLAKEEDWVRENFTDSFP